MKHSLKIEKCDGVTVRHCCCQKLTLDPGTVHQFMHPPFVQRDLMLLPAANPLCCLVIEKLKNKIIQKKIQQQ
jgi:hypothetical protein